MSGAGRRGRPRISISVRDQTPGRVSLDQRVSLCARSGRKPLTDQPPAKPSDLIYEDTGAMAPLVYFDIVGAYGTMNGAVEVELATRILVPKPDGSTEVKFISSGRIRCSANAAANLRNGLDAALKMLEQPQAHRVDCGGEAELSDGPLFP